MGLDYLYGSSYGFALEKETELQLALGLGLLGITIRDFL